MRVFERKEIDIQDSNHCSSRVQLQWFVRKVSARKISGNESMVIRLMAAKTKRFFAKPPRTLFGAQLPGRSGMFLITLRGNGCLVPFLGELAELITVACNYLKNGRS